MSKIIFVLTFLISLPSFALDYGLDRLGEPEVIEKLQNKKLAVLTHAAARNHQGEHLIDLLFKSFQLVKIFAPEHGLRTMSDDWVGDGTDESTGLPVISLYKRNSKAPTPEDLKGVEAVVIDLQDVGVRYYTYFSTIAEVMKACAPLGIEVIILDRPNLLGGNVMEGKVLDPELAGKFTAYHTVPVRHGMTLGELGRMINAEKKIGAKLTVVPAAGWDRGPLLFNLERTWIAPSPALTELTQVGLYALWGTLESLNLAVGRGQTNELAFKVIGAPWITEGRSIHLAAELNRLGLKGLQFKPFSWDVTRAKYEGKRANGVSLHWDGSAVRSDEVTYKVSWLLIQLFPKNIGLELLPASSYGSKKIVEALKKGTPWDTVKKDIDAELKAFAARRVPYLLY